MAGDDAAGSISLDKASEVFGMTLPLTFTRRRYGVSDLARLYREIAGTTHIDQD